MDKFRVDSHKLLWHLDRVADWKKEKVIPPIYIEVSPISACNHKCIFCGIDFAKEKTSKLDTELFCKRIKELGEVGIRSMMFAGEGEPLLHKDLPLFVRIAKESNIDVSITTNGSLGTPKLWNETLQFLTWIRFSIDAGTPEVYANVHNVKKVLFDNTIKSLEDAVKIKKDNNLKVTISAQFLIMDENLGDLENAITLFDAIGVDYLSLKPYSLHPQMLNKKEVIYTKDILDHIQSIVDKYKGKVNIVFRKDAMVKYMKTKKTISHCHALPFWGYISSDGDFYTCSVFIGDSRFKAGNIYKKNIRQIIFGELRKNSIEYGKKSLKIKDECRLNCRMDRVNEFLEDLENEPQHVSFI